MSKLEKKEKRIEKLKEKEEQKRLKKEERSKKLESRKNKMTFRAQRTIKEDEDVVFAPKNTSWKRVVAILLWLVIAFFTVQGVLAVMNRETSEEVTNTLEKRYAELTDSQDIMNESGTFVASFLCDYYRYDSESEDKWGTRVEKYLGNGVLLEEPDNSIASSALQDCQIRSIDVDGRYIKVNTSVQVYYHSIEQKGDNVTEKEGISRHQLDVLVETDGTNYAIASEPVYVSDQNRANRLTPTTDLPDGDTVNKDASAALQITAENFLKAYYGTDTSELKYYVTKDSGINKVVGGGITFSKIETFTVTRISGGDYVAKARVYLNNGYGEMRETIFLTMTRGDEDRVYISKIDVK